MGTVPTGKQAAQAGDRVSPVQSALALLFIGLALLLAAAPASAEVSIDARLDQESMPINGRATLTVTVTGSTRADEPQMPDLPDFAVFFAGSSRMVSMVNFKTTTSTVFTYELVPKRAGRFEIPPIALEHGDERLTTRPIAIEVVDAQASQSRAESRDRNPAAGRSGEPDGRAVFMEAEAEPSSVYVGEQVTLVVRFFHSVRLAETPAYQRPSTTGFWVEEFKDSESYFTEIEDRRYSVTELRYALFPTEAGTLTIGPAQADCRIITRGDPFRRDPFSLFDAFGRSEPRHIATDPIEIEVRELPRTGRPGSWNGAVGRYELSAEIDKQEVGVGDAATLEVTIRGIGNTRTIGDPELPEVDGLRSYMAESSVRDLRDEERIGGAKTLRKVYIPGASGTFEIPAIRYAFFDPSVGGYEEVRTAPIRITVSGASESGAGEGRGPAGRQTFGGVAPELSFIRLGDPGLERRGGPLHRSALFWLVQVIPLLALAAGLVYARHVERVRGDVGYARLRRSGRIAARRLREARRELAAGEVDTFLSALSAALVGYVADRANQSAPGMTLGQARTILEERGIEPAVIEQFVECVEHCDYGRFAPGLQEQSERGRLLGEAEAILQQLGRAGL